MATVSQPKVKFQGRTLPLNRMDSRSYLVQPEMSPSPEAVPSPTYSFCKETGYPNRDVFKEKSWRNDSISSDVPLLLHSGNLSPQLSQSIPMCRPAHAGSMTQSNHIYGVGDLEHVHIEGMNRNNPKMYDYADYGHQYEELPGGRKSTAKYPLDMDSNSQYQSSGGATDIVSETDDTADIVKGSSDKRKRVNPLYDAMTQSMPSIYNKNKSSKDEKLRRQVRCLKCALIVLFIFCCASLAVSIFTVITYMGSKDDPDEEHSTKHSGLAERLDKLTSDYANLQEVLKSAQGSNSTVEMMTNLVHKVSEIERNSSAQIGILHQQIENLEKNISHNSDTIDYVYTNLKVDVTNLTASVQQQLDTISKMEGPRGPQGVANFSRCLYSNVTNNSPASPLHPSYTGYAPSEQDLENTVAIFAACSVTNGISAMLETNAISDAHVQFRCICSGVADENDSRRYCYLHLFTCPRYS